MIRNQSDLKLVREQLHRVRSVLESIEARVRPVNEARFELIAEAYRGQIAAHPGRDRRVPREGLAGEKASERLS